jgi:hypothetical protein
MAAMPSRLVLYGIVNIPLPVDRAMHLFTPEGEREWAPGWDPSYPAGLSGDGSATGTVFVTEHGADTIWAVVQRTDDTVRYARVTPGRWAGLVDVRCRPEGPDATCAAVTYDLTALTEEGETALQEFAAGYDEYLAEWERVLSG